MQRKIFFILLSQLFVLTLFGQSKSDSLLYNSGGLKIYSSKAFFNKSKIYDAEEDLLKVIKSEDTTECKLFYEYQYHPLSLVGKYYSYESFEGGNYACGPPGSSMAVKAIDLETLKPVKITDLFTEESLVKAIKKDQWFISNIVLDSTKNLDHLSTLDTLMKMMSYYRFTESGFAVLNYNKKSGVAAIRLVGVHYMGFNHSRHLTLGLHVKPREEKRKLFEGKGNFYLNKFKNGVY